MHSDYRQRFGEFHTQLYRDKYLYGSGQTAARETGRIYSEFSDLFTESIARELHAALEEVSESKETERTSIRRLIAFAIEGNLASRLRDISEEIAQYESAARMGWDGEKIALSEVDRLLTREPDATRRHDLFAWCTDALKRSNDLRAERIERRNDAVKTLGYDNGLALKRELRGLDAAKLAGMADRILAATSSLYTAALAPLLVRQTGVSIAGATEADLARLEHFPQFDVFFPREQMLRHYRDLFAALGFDTGKQSNLELDAAPRPRKQLQAFCAPIHIPSEIKLVFQSIGGQGNYREFLREAGHAQHFAWTSKNLYPEFRVGGDRAVDLAWGMLFENLMLDEHWLMGTFGFVESSEFRHTLAVFRMLDVRKQAAMLIYESELFGGTSLADAAARYAERMADALRVRFDGTGYLRSLDGHFFSADALRARAFEAQLREHLKTRFGLRWWASRKAGEMLIDLWNTGQRHTVEQLAAMIGLGELDFDWLSAELQTQAGA